MKKYILFTILLLSMFHVKHVSALDFSNIKYLATYQLSIGETATGTIDTRNETTSNRLVASKTYSTNFSDLNGFTSDVIVFGGQFLVSNITRTYQAGTGDIIGSDTSNNNYRLYTYSDSDTPTISIDISELIIWTINTNKGDFRCEFDKNGIVLCPYKLLGSDTTINSITVFFEFPNYADNQNLNSYNLFYYYTNIGGRVWFINYYNNKNLENLLTDIKDLIGGKCEVSNSLLNFDLTGKYISTTNTLGNNSGFSSTSSYYTGLDSITISGDNLVWDNIGRVAVYDSNKNFIESIALTTNNRTMELDSSKFYRFSLVNGNTYNITYCSKGLTDSINSINQGTQDINNSINDSNVSGGGSISDMSSSVADDSGIEDIFLLPVRLIQNVLNSLNSNTCTPINLGSLYGTNLQFSCINLQNLLGSTIYNTIDIFFAFGVILGVRKYILEIFERISSLKEDNLID